MPAPAAEDSLIGFVLADKYRIVGQIGRGGMGVVYEAEHMQLGKRVAIKLMLEKYADDTEAIARFQREALAASRIGNQHIIDVSDIGVAPNGRSFVVMELLLGMPLSQVRELSGPMPAWRAVNIIRQVLRGVGAAHSKGIIHRDLKPDNIFLVGHDDQHDFVKLLDFGISKVIDLDEQVAFTKLTHTGVVMGTPLYMAPEQAQGLPITAAADIYACGVILYELLAGRPPFEGQTYAVLVAKLLTAEPEYLGTLRPGLPLALVNAVHRALEKDPQRRHASAEQFAAALPGDRTPSQLELAGTIDSGMAVARVSAPHRTPKRPWLAISGALLVGVATAGVLIATQTGGGGSGQGTPTTTAKSEPGSEAKAPQLPEPTKTPPQPPPQVQTGTLEIKTVPVGAQVVVDDNVDGATSSGARITLAVGTHKVRVELLGYATYEGDVEIHANAAVIIPMTMTLQPVVASKKPPKGGTAKKPPLDLNALGKKPPATPKDKDKDKPVPQPLPQPTVEAKTVGKPPPVDDDAVPPKTKPLPLPQTTGTKPNPY